MTKTTNAATVAKPAQAAQAPKPQPKGYTLTDKGKAFAPKPGTLRAQAWALLVQHAGQPGGKAALAAAMPKGSIGTITVANLLGWAATQGLLTDA